MGGGRFPGIAGVSLHRLESIVLNRNGFATEVHRNRLAVENVNHRAGYQLGSGKIRALQRSGRLVLEREIERDNLVAIQQGQIIGSHRHSEYQGDVLIASRRHDD